MRKLLAALAVLLVLCAGGLGVVRSSVSEDPGPELVVPAAHVAPDPAAWAEAESAFALLGASDLSGVLQDDAPPDPTLLILWQENAAALDAFDHLVERQALSVPTPVAVDDPGPDLRPLNQLAQASALRGWELASVDAALAVEAMLEPARWGATLKDAEGDLVSFAMGATLMNGSFDQVEVLIGLRGDEATLRAAYEGLMALPVRRSAARAVAFECAWVESVWDDEQALLETGYPSWSRGLVYDGDTTLAWHRQRCRALVEQYARPWRDREEVVLPARWSGAGPVRFLHNPVGRILMDVAVADYGRIVEREDLAFARHAGLLATLALRLDEAVPGADGLGGSLLIGPDYVAVEGPVELAGEARDLRWNFPVDGVAPAQ